MSTQNTYTEAFREQALKKVYGRGQRTIQHQRGQTRLI